ncbi:MAG: YbjN domain-containing protein [Actinomycetota bacterium]|nr:YbjN domain-containing protein [Actinomycetota bacterium]
MSDPFALPAAVREALAALQGRGDGLEFEEGPPGTFTVTLPGERKLRTTCSLVVGRHGVSVNAFVARAPDENREQVYRWLLERNARSYAVSFAVDHLGDIYLVGKLPHATAVGEELDRLLGSVLELADGAFNPILELGFPTAIRREWEWRRRRGESTANLAAFAHLVERG